MLVLREIWRVLRNSLKVLHLGQMDLKFIQPLLFVARDFMNCGKLEGVVNFLDFVMLHVFFPSLTSFINNPITLISCNLVVDSTKTILLDANLKLLLQ